MISKSAFGSLLSSMPQPLAPSLPHLPPPSNCFVSSIAVDSARVSELQPLHHQIRRVVGCHAATQPCTCAVSSCSYSRPLPFPLYFPFCPPPLLASGTYLHTPHHTTPFAFPFPLSSGRLGSVCGRLRRLGRRHTRAWTCTWCWTSSTPGTACRGQTAARSRCADDDDDGAGDRDGDRGSGGKP